MNNHWLYGLFDKEIFLFFSFVTSSSSYNRYLSERGVNIVMTSKTETEIRRDVSGKAGYSSIVIFNYEIKTQLVYIIYIYIYIIQYRNLLRIKFNIPRPPIRFSNHYTHPRQSLSIRDTIRKNESVCMSVSFFVSIHRWIKIVLLSNFRM